MGGVVAAIACALLIDKVGRKRWYTGAFLLAPVPLIALAFLGSTTPMQVLVLAGLAYAIVQTITFSLYLYSAEIYPIRLRALGTGLGSAWLRLGSFAGPLVVGFTMAHFGIQYVFAIFAGFLLLGSHHRPLRHRDQRSGSGGTLPVTRRATLATSQYGTGEPLPSCFRVQSARQKSQDARSVGDAWVGFGLEGWRARLVIHPRGARGSARRGGCQAAVWIFRLRLRL